MASLHTTTSTRSTSKDEKYRMSQLDLHNTSIANQVGTKTGDLDVEKAVDLLLKTRKSNKLLTKVIVCLIGYSFIITAAIFGVSVIAAEIAKDTTIDSDTGFVHAKNGNTIMKTSDAIEYAKPNSIHGLSDEDLAHLLTVQFRDGALMLHVKGFSRTEERTMLLVEGGVLSFSDTGIFDIAGEHIKLLFETFDVEGGRSLEETPNDIVCGVTSTPIDQVPDGTESLDVRINTLTVPNSDPTPKTTPSPKSNTKPTKNKFKGSTKISSPSKIPSPKSKTKEQPRGSIYYKRSSKEPSEGRRRTQKPTDAITVEALVDQVDVTKLGEENADSAEEAAKKQVMHDLVTNLGGEFQDENPDLFADVVVAEQDEDPGW